MARWLAAPLLLAAAAAASAEPVVDGFEAGALGPCWTPRAVPGHVAVQRDADDPPDVYFRLGLYRNRTPQPMTIYFDDFRRERLAQ